MKYNRQKIILEVSFSGGSIYGKSKVEFVYKNISSLNKISIVNKKIFRILPYICVPSLAIGGIAVFLKEMLPIKGVLPNYIRLVCLVIFFLTFLMWLVSFFLIHFPVFMEMPCM